MLLQVATGAVTALTGGTSGIATAVGGGLLSGVESKWFGGASRDAQRQQRVAALLGAANAGSVRAAQIIYAGPDNVAADEAGFWRSAWSSLSAEMQSAAMAAGKEWPTGQPFDMPNERSVIQGQLASIGSSYVMSSLGGTPVATNVLTPLQTAIGNTIQTVGTGIVNQTAGAVNPRGGYVTIPTSSGTLVLVAVIAVLGVIALTHHNEH